jgi:excisionase family DNA binding protein
LSELSGGFPSGFSGLSGNRKLAFPAENTFLPVVSKHIDRIHVTSYDVNPNFHGTRMKVRNTQSDPRKNPDSPRVHGLRLSLNSSSAIVENSENSNDRVEPRSSSTVIDYKREGIQSDNSDAGFERLLDVAEAARLLRMHPRTLRTKARKRTIPAVQVGRRWRFRASALNDWLGKLAS